MSAISAFTIPSTSTTTQSQKTGRNNPAAALPGSLASSSQQAVRNSFKSSQKRAHSPDIPVTLAAAGTSGLGDSGYGLGDLVSEFGQGPSKSSSSPSTRERSQYISNSSTSARAAGPLDTPTAGVLSDSLQQATIGASTGQSMMDSQQYSTAQFAQPNGNVSTQQASPGKTHQRSATTGSAAAFPASSPYASAGKTGVDQQQQQQQSQYAQNFRVPSHSGSTTSGFSAGSNGSSYDSVISLDNSGLGSIASGLGVVVEGAAYTSPSPGQMAGYSTGGSYAQVPAASQAAGGYYAQPYGYQPTTQVAYTGQSGSGAVYSNPGSAPQGYVQPAVQIGSLRRSIAGQSTGGSSYQSGASNSPVTSTQRRSQDMDGTFISPVQPVSSQISYTPITDTGSPALGGVQYAQPQPVYTQVQLQQAQAGMAQPSPKAAYVAADATSATQPYYAPPAQDYQSVVDQIMSQSRKGTDYGLDLGDFEMLDTLGTGTFGRVLLVRFVPKPGVVSPLSAGMPHYFAMKVLTKTEVVRLKQVEHINCERSILGAVDNPGIVNLFCTFQDSLNIYMLLEFVQGGELFSHLRRAVRFSADVSRFYAANIILVLEYLHNRNLIYRDLKPENLLLDSTGYLKVTDFGFAKYVPDRTFTLCGTPEYLAPEIINSAGHGKAADWWAFGVLLFEMLCGYPPFFDESPWGIYEKILAGNFSFPPHVDPVARDLVRRLLSSDRSKRLGNLRNGAQDVKNHQWFEGVDWNAVERRLIPAPIVPRIKSTSDSQNFERYPSIPIESLPGLARAKGYQIKETVDPYEQLFTSF